MVLFHIQDTGWGKGLRPAEEMQLAYSTAPANWADETYSHETDMRR